MNLMTKWIYYLAKTKKYKGNNFYIFNLYNRNVKRSRENVEIIDKEQNVNVYRRCIISVRFV